MSRGHWVALISALIVFTAVVVVLWPRATDPTIPSQALAMPQRGAVNAEFAADGHPVWVVGHDDGSISVLDAFSTHDPFGVNKPTWFCPGSRVFEDPFHGSRYDEFGDRIAGPAPIGLGAYAFEVGGGQILIASEPRAGRRAPGSGLGGEPPAGCATEDALVHDYTRLSEAQSPADAQASSGGWLRLHATLIPDPATASGLLCPGRVPADGCASVDLPGMEHLLGTPDDRAQASVEAWTDTGWLIHVVDGRIVEIADLFD